MISRLLLLASAVGLATVSSRADTLSEFTGTETGTLQVTVMQLPAADSLDRIYEIFIDAVDGGKVARLVSRASTDAWKPGTPLVVTHKLCYPVQVAGYAESGAVQDLSPCSRLGGAEQSTISLSLVAQDGYVSISGTLAHQEPGPGPDGSNHSEQSFTSQVFGPSDDFVLTISRQERVEAGNSPLLATVATADCEPKRAE